MWRGSHHNKSRLVQNRAKAILFAIKRSKGWNHINDHSIVVFILSDIAKNSLLVAHAIIYKRLIVNMLMFLVRLVNRFEYIMRFV